MGHGAFLKQQGHPSNMTPHHAVPPRGDNGPRWTGKRTFLILNFTQKDAGKRALPLTHPWQEHSFLWMAALLVLTKNPWHFHSKTDEDLPRRSDLPCSREEERQQGEMAKDGQTRGSKATTPASAKGPEAGLAKAVDPQIDHRPFLAPVAGSPTEATIGWREGSEPFCNAAGGP